jgi:hypothetical protein
MKTIFEFKAGDKITRLKPAEQFNDRSYMGDELTFIGIANGKIYFKDHDDKRKQLFDLVKLKNFIAYKHEENNPSWCYRNYLNARSLKAADNVREQLRRIMERLKFHLLSPDFEDKKNYNRDIRKAITAGFFMQVAHLEKTKDFLTVKDNQVYLLIYLST